MVFPQKRILFFLFAVLVLGASPALSVPLSSGVENPSVAAYGASGYTDPDGGTTLPVDGTADRVGIVDHKEVAMSTVSGHSEESATQSEVGMSGQATMGHATPGWIVPAAAVGAGGGALFAILSHDKGGSSSTSSLDASADLGASGSGGGTIAMGTNDNTPGGNDVPEPGTLMLMGAGIASFLGRRRMFSR
jgi:hypothetical protein